MEMLHRLLFVTALLYLPTTKSDDTNDAVRLTAAAAAAAAAALPAKSDSAQIFPPEGCTVLSCNASTVAAWHAIISNWRDAVLANLKYNASVYSIEALQWTQTSYVQPQMHPYDRFLWDPKLRAWTVEKYLADLRTRYGGIDSVLVWPTYTNIGCDDRNQFDMIRAMPGGIAGIRSLSSQLHAHGVKMLVPYHRWDQGTRRETCPSVQPGCNKTGQMMDDANAIAALLASANVDGFNGDAEPFVEKKFATAALARNHPLAFEPESEVGQTPLAVIEWDTMSWGEHWGFQNGPPIVDAKKWLTRGAHNSNICSRWTHAIDTMIATSWFNGIGIESWENVWGSWAGKTPRAAHQIRVLGSMLRFAGGHTHGGDAQEDPPSNRSLLRSPLWLPYAPLMTTANQTQAQVYASTWPSDGELYLSTVVVADRSAALGNGTVKVTFELDSRVKVPGFHCYDAYRGRELAMPSGGGTMTVELDASCGGSNPAVELSIAGIGGLLFTKETPASDSSLEAYLKRMQQLTARSTNMYTCEGGGHCYKKIGPAPPFEKNNGSPWPFYKTCTETHCAGLTQTMIPIAKTKLYASAPPGTVPVPGGSYLFTTRGAEIEGSPGVGVDFQFPWESEPGALFPDHAPHLLSMPPLFADKFPVTNADYAKYLLTSKYVPADKEHWLEKNFASDKKTVKPGWNRRPVTYVSLNDARAYCSYYGKRLPNVWDWQWVAGQAADMRIYPWSNEPPSNRTCPEVASGTGKNLTFDGPRDVDELDDCSSHGVCNLIGNVWQLTNEFEDQHTRSVLLKGGSNYRPAGSAWYLPQVRRLDLHQKYMLFSDGYERSATIGFRCVADSAQQCGNLCVETLPFNSGAETSAVNLTFGSDDWLAYDGSKLERKMLPAGTSHRLVGVNLANSTAVQTAGPALSWSDGTSDKFNTGENLGISADALSFTALATAESSLLTMYLGAANAAMNLSASLSDGSAPSFVAPLLLGPAVAEAGVAPVSQVVHLKFRSSKPGTVLTVKLGRGRGVCDHCLKDRRCLCAQSGEQTPPVTGAANLTNEASLGGDWITIQDGFPQTSKNKPTLFRKAGTERVSIPLTLNYMENDTITSNYSALGVGWLRCYGASGAGSPLRIGWDDGPSVRPKVSNLGAGVFVASMGAGFVIQAPASSTSVRIMTIYGGCDGSTCRMEASTGAGASLTRQVVSTGGSIPYKFVLAFKGEGKLTVKYFCVPSDALHGDYAKKRAPCNLTFQGVAVRIDEAGAVLLKGAKIVVL